MASGESSPLATCWPLSHADDPWLTPLGLGPSSFRKEGVGAGHRTCAHAPLLLRPHPASAISTSAARSSGSLAAGRPESQVSGSLGGGGETDWAEQPFPQTPGLLSQAAAVPSPSAFADNGRFTAGCRC